MQDSIPQAPTKVDFLLAEDFRQEEGNKFTVIGLLNGNDVRIVGAEAGKALPSLAILATVRDGAGNLNLVGDLFTPSGKKLGETKGVAIKPADASASILFKWLPFPVPEFGPYLLKLSLEGKVFEFRFQISNQKTSVT